MSISLNKRIFRLVVGLVLVTAITILVTVWISTSQHAKKQLNTDLKVAQNILEQVLNNRENMLFNSATVLTDDFGFKQAVATADKLTINSVLGNHGARINADVMALFSLTGQTITSVPNLLNTDEEVSYPYLIKKAIGKGGAASILSINGKLYQVLLLAVKAPRPIAVALVGFEIDVTVAQQLKNISQLETTIEVIGQQGEQYNISTLPSENQGTEDDEFDNTLFSWMKLVFSSNEQLISTSFSLIKNDKLEVAIILSDTVEHLFSAFLSLQITIIFIGIASILTAMLFAALFSRQMVRPIEALTKYAQLISKGEYAKKIHIKATSTEFNYLSDAFSTMQHNIRDREKKIAHQAQHDSLTNLYNRNHIENVLHDKFVAKLCFQVIGINIHGFRNINDVYGYHNGDHCLKTLANRVMALNGICARLNGGELLWVPNTAMTIAELETLQKSLEQDIVIDTINMPMKVVMGIIDCPSDTHSTGDLFRRMNIVLDEAQATKTHLLKFDPAFEGRYLRRLSLITELKETLKHRHHELTLFYQPKLQTSTGKVVSAEALIRWNSESLGFIPPDDFINIAEQMGIIGELTHWVFKQAIRDIVEFRKQNIHITVAINMSTQDVMSDTLLPNVLSELENNQLPSSVLSFEMTESDIVKDPAAALIQLQKMRDAGFKIAIDDFGTGYSSLAYLTQLPIDILKVDKSFVLKLDTTPNDQTIVQTVIALAHNFNLQVVAEGIENEHSLALLKQWGCEYAQGYFISRPIPAETFISWYHEKFN